MIRKLAGHGSYVFCIAFAPNRTQLASGSSDRSIIIWDLASGKQMRQIKGNFPFLYTVAYCKRGSQLAFGGLDGYIYIYDIYSDSLVQKIAAHTSYVTTILFFPNHLVSVSGDKTIRMWNYNQLENDGSGSFKSSKTSS